MEKRKRLENMGRGEGRMETTIRDNKREKKPISNTLA
jgi:hypothetical protein